MEEQLQFELKKNELEKKELKYMRDEAAWVEERKKYGSRKEKRDGKYQQLQEPVAKQEKKLL